MFAKTVLIASTNIRLVQKLITWCHWQ